MIPKTNRLRNHADYQRVYKASRKQFGKPAAYFFLLRTQPVESAARNPGARIGLTVGKVMGKSVDRNCIKRRMRAAVGNHLSLLTAPVDVVLHPKRSVIDWDFPALNREVAAILSTIQRAAERQLASPRADRGASESKAQ